ncbi:hypothetical protein SLS58_006101 [Diplodia intermedia]|uniref:Uncharacterized protein n=1 Tax=Diplodia intermedia TaxID=856260 RepID=A0ABR3TP19_9PEZI
MVNPEARLMPGGEFREEHAQIDDMIRNLALNDEQGEGSLHDVSTPMALTPKSAKHSRRDISDRSLKSLVPTKATLELLALSITARTRTILGTLQELQTWGDSGDAAAYVIFALIAAVSLI